MSRAGNSATFSPRAVLAMLALGFAAFLLGLVALATGLGDPSENNGDGHALSNSLLGYTALTRMLEATDHDVAVIRDRGGLDTYDVLVLTPPHDADPDEISKIIEDRRLRGPTILVLPKWFAYRAPKKPLSNTQPGWVIPVSPYSPEWFGKLEVFDEPQVEVADEDERSPTIWPGLERRVALPEDDLQQFFEAGTFVPLVEDSDGRMLAGFLDDGGDYPDLHYLAGVDHSEGGEAYYDDEYSEEYEYDDYDEYDPAVDYWPVVVVSEPDLLNNWGMADRERAELAVELLDIVAGTGGSTIRFDVTLNGLGHVQNLLTLAFTPPFLAATLCLILAAAVIGWRSFRRFGPPVAEEPEIAFGKAQLVGNGARLIERARRLHLLGAPYAELLLRRIARKLGIRQTAAVQGLEDEVEARLATRLGEAPNVPSLLAALKQARGPHELLRAAAALKKIERML